MVANKDPSQRHFNISIVKSAMRMIGCVGILFGGLAYIKFFGVMFLLAEVLGIIEEF